MDGPGLAGIAAAFTAFQGLQLDSGTWLQFIILSVALLLCGTSAAAETALTSISHIKLRNLIDDGDQKAEKIEHLLAEPNTFLLTVLIINIVAVIVIASITIVLALRLSGTWGELAAILLTALIVLVFCEIMPKTAAAQNPLRWARIVVQPVRLLARLLYPLLWLLNTLSAMLLRMMGGQLTHRGPFVTEEELRLMVTAGEEEGVLEEDETEMIHSIFEFADTPVRAVMVPRIDMVTLPSDATVNQAVDLALEGGFSRIPVYEASLGGDEIIGVLYTKDMLKQLREGHSSSPITDLIRPAYYVPETKKLDALLREIRQNRVHIVIVIDEYGAVAGLVTIEDLVEEIVGDIQDEYDHEEKLYEKLGEGEYIFDAKISIHDFNDKMNMHLEDEDYETLGGFVYAQLDKLPNAGDTITYEHVIFTVLANRGRRITKIRVKREDAPPAAQQPELSEQLPEVPSMQQTNEPQNEQLQQTQEEASHYQYREIGS